MHLKTLRNFLLIVLCTIGIGFASAPPAAAALTITKGDGKAISDPEFFTAVNGTTVNTEYKDTGCRKFTVKVSGATGEITPTLSLQNNNDGGNTNILNEFYVYRTAKDANSSTFIIYYVPENATSNSARVYVNFTSGGETVKARFAPLFTDTNKKSSVTPQFEGVCVYPHTSGSFTLYETDASGKEITTQSLYVTSSNGAAKEISFLVKGVNTTGAPTVTFGSHGSELKYRTEQKQDVRTNYLVYVTWTPTTHVDPAEVITATVSMPGANESKQVKLRLFYAKPVAQTGSITLDGPASTTAADGYYALSAVSTNTEWTGKGRIVRNLTVTGSGISGNITLSVSPMGNYGLTVSPTTLPAEGGKVTIIYKPKSGDKYYNPNGNNADEKKWPVLTIKADNAAAKTVQLRTTWDKTTVTEGVTPVPVIQPGDFDPDIYECKTYKGRNTVSLRWEPKNPNEIKLVEYTQAQIDGEADATKKSWMQSWNEAYNNNIAFKYTLYRDGKVIVSDLDISSYVDMNVPVGDHTYYVKAHYINGRTANSTEQTVTVERDMAITNYVLEEVYNYPIVNQTTDNNISGVNTFNAYGTIAGDDPNVQREGFLYKYNYPGDPNGSGSPGDGVRQAVFRDGHWYIAMVSNRYSNNGAIGYKTGANYNASERGHILKINADENIYQNPLKIYAELRTLSNQSLAMTEDAQYNFYFRGYNGNPGDLDNGKINLVNGDQYFKPMFSYGYKLGNGSVQYKANDIPEISGIDKTAQGQYYRTHYMAARGKVADGKGKLCFAQNESHDAYIVDLDNSGNPKAYHKITAPRQAVTNYGGKQRIIDIEAGTENYIFPVEGEPNKYIHVMRSSGIFLVDVTDINNPIYTLITADLSEVRSASGQTFTLYNSMDGSTDLFYIHGTSLYSNNPGHFRIDMPQRTKDAQGHYTGDISTANFSDMVPMASKLQDAIPGFDAGNSNGMWFGTEDATEDKIAVKYIYQYVPGVRFAKYKFYPVQAFPPARPTIDVVIRHDDPAKDATPQEADDITHFDIEYSWKRPANFDTVGDATNFKIDGYNYELLDPNGNVLQKGDVETLDNETDETTYGPFYYNQHQPAAGGKLDFSSYNPETAGEAGIFDVHDGKYTIRVTPVYASTSDTSRKYTGESGLAQDDAKYTPEIYNIRAKLWQASGNSNLYRVDIDFNRAPRTAAEAAGNTVKEGNETDYTYRHGTESNASDYLQPEPASRFKIEVDKGDGRGFQPISNLRIVYDGNILYNPNDAAENAEAKKIEDNFDDHNPGQTIHHGKHDGYVKHDYNFGGYFSSNGRRNVKARAGEGNRGDKMYAQEANHLFYGGNPSESQETQDLVNIEKQKGAFPVVAYHMVDGSKEDISNLYNWTYRATALYADNQPYESIKGQASVQTTLGLPTTTGVDDVTADAENGGVHIWPVPAESELHISAGEAIETVSIFNISGACVATFEGNNDTAMTVNVDNLASGVYLVKVNANAARRLIKR